MSWQRIYGTDRKYTRRVDRAKERDAYTPIGTKPNVRGSKAARRELAVEAEAEAAFTTPINPDPLTVYTKSNKKPRPVEFVKP